MKLLRPRVGLKGMLGLMLCGGVMLGVTGSCVHRGQIQKRAAAELQDLGFRITYDNPRPQQSWGMLRGWLGHDSFDTVIGAATYLIPSPINDETLAAARPSFAKLPSLRYLDLSYSSVSDEGLKELAACSGLEVLKLSHCKYISLEGDCVLGSLRRLKRLDLSHTQIDDDSIACISAARSLETVVVTKTPMTDYGVTRLRKAAPLTCKVYDD